MIKKSKPIMSVLAAICIVISQAAVVFADNAQETVDFGLLEGLGIAEAGADVAASATRADLAHVGLALINRLNDFDGAEISEIYNDVEEKAAQIYGANVTGIMVGDGSGSFMPDAAITKEMISAVMGRVLGYGALARNEWESFGFNEADLYRRVKISEPVTLGELYAVAENCLEENLISVKPGYDRYGRCFDADASR